MDQLLRKCIKSQQPYTCSRSRRSSLSADQVELQPAVFFSSLADSRINLLIQILQYPQRQLSASVSFLDASTFEVTSSLGSSSNG